MASLLRDVRSRSRSLRVRVYGVPMWLVAAAVVVGAVVAGDWLNGGTRRTIVIAGAAGALTILLLAPIVRARVTSGFAAVELPMMLLLFSGIVLRERDAESLATNPLDPAGMYRVACLGGAMALGMLALTHPASEGRRAGLTRPFRLYVAYALSVFVSAVVSVDPLLTGFRGFELMALVAVVAGAARSFGRDAIRRGLRLMFGWYLGLAILVWMGVLLMPERSVVQLTRSPLPIQIAGAFPMISSNGVGTIGTILAIWSLAILVSRVDEGVARRGWMKLVFVLGVTTLVFAQYRTGYVAFTIGLIVVLAFRRRAALLWVLVIGITIGALWGGPLLRSATPVALRGADVTEASQLSSRVKWWQAAISVWEESPWIGRGLRTATRFEVLDPLGRGTTSSIHGTWVEALVGTGILGAGLLLAAFVIFLARATKEAAMGGRIVPVALGVILSIRSLTGPTFESLSDTALLFALLASWIPDGGSPLLRRPASISARGPA